MFNAIARLLYFLNGVLFLAAGASILLLGTNYLPDRIRQFIMHEAESHGRTLHLMQEAACLLVFGGVVLLWLAWHYEQGRILHWAITLFWALFALVHWFDPAGQFHSGTGQALLTAPFVVFAVVGWLRR